MPAWKERRSSEKRKQQNEKAQHRCWALKSGATHEVRTRDLNLGKVALYQLS